jgi:hypothetical protein
MDPRVKPAGDSIEWSSAAATDRKPRRLGYTRDLIPL